MLRSRAFILAVVLSNELDVDLDLHALADEEATRLEHLIPGDVEVLAVDLRRREEAGPHVAPRVDGGAAELHIQRHRLGDVPHRQLTIDPPAIAGRSKARAAVP